MGDKGKRTAHTASKIGVETGVYVLHDDAMFGSFLGVGDGLEGEVLAHNGQSRGDVTEE